MQTTTTTKNPARKWETYELWVGKNNWKNNWKIPVITTLTVALNQQTQKVSN